MNAGSLFSGIEGLGLGLGLPPTFLCESDKHCRVVLERHFPGVPIVPDIRELDAGTPRVDVLHGGYPCQPFSNAGRRRGEDDPRHLWPEFAHVVRLLRPRVVVIENVEAHLRLGFDSVLCDFAEMGMDVRWGVVRASDVGAPHGRARLFAVASHGPCPEWREAELASMASPAGGAAEPGERARSDWGIFGKAIERWERIHGPCPEPLERDNSLRPEWAEWFMGFPTGWTEGIPPLDRLRLLGNAVIPAQASLALSLLR